MDQQGDADYMLAYLTHCHGLGLAKAGFLLQLTFGLSGCIDTHNARRYGVDMAARTFRIEDRPTKPATRLAKAKRYNALVETMGGTESLWDTWCEYVAANQADFYNDADHVSRLHIEALNL